MTRWPPEKTEPDPLTLGARLRIVMELKKLSMRDLARLAGVSASIVSRCVRGKDLSVKSLLKIAKALDVRASWFLDGAESKP